MWAGEAAALKWGWVGAKGRVLDADGHPIWSEYAENGSVVRDIDDADPEILSTARVMSAANTGPTSKPTRPSATSTAASARSFPVKPTKPGFYLPRQRR